MASRLSHELRTPIAVVRSSLDNLKQTPLPDDARVYMERAQEGLDAADHDPDADDRGHAARAEPVPTSSASASTSRAVVAGCVDGYRQAYPAAHIAFDAARRAQFWSTARPISIAQMLDKLVANAVEFGNEPADRRSASCATATTRCCRVSNEGPPLPDTHGRSPVRFDGVGARRAATRPSRIWDSAFTSCGSSRSSTAARAEARNRDGRPGVVVDGDAALRVRSILELHGWCGQPIGIERSFWPKIKLSKTA